MVMTLNRLVSWLRYKIRAFLGLDVLPTRLEIIEIRQLIESNQREILLKLNPQAKSSLFENYTRPPIDWEALQRSQLAEMLSKPPKED